MIKHFFPPIFKEAIETIERMQLLGFPGTNNIVEMKKLIAQLELLSSNFKDPAHRVSIKQLREILNKIDKKLMLDEDIPVRMYQKLNAQLVIFKENLITQCIKKP